MQISRYIWTRVVSDVTVESLRCHYLYSMFSILKERMVQLQDAQQGAEVTSEATERELELEAQLVEARSIIQEQVFKYYQVQ